MENEQEISGFRLAANGIMTYFHAAFSRPWSTMEYQAESLTLENKSRLLGKNLKAAFLFDGGKAMTRTIPTCRRSG